MTVQGARSKAITNAANTLLSYGGMELSSEDVAWLAEDVREDVAVERRKALIESAVRGFIRAACDGYLFAPESEIKARFGRSIAENYPDGTKEFLGFARTYWSFRTVADHLYPDVSGSARVLSGVDANIAPLFFPTPGPAVIDPAVREETQRRILQWAGATFDIEEFIRGNPILIRDRQAGRSGCAGSLVFVIAGSLLAGVRSLRG